MPGTAPESPGTDMRWMLGQKDREKHQACKGVSISTKTSCPHAPSLHPPPVSFPTPQPDLPAPRLWVAPSAQKLGSAVLPKLPRGWI